MNISGAWRLGFTGKNVVVTILDDGIEKDHPDLIQNYVSVSLSFVICVRVLLLFLQCMSIHLLHVFGMNILHAFLGSSSQY